MILRMCPYQISKNKQCSHFLKTILSIVNWLISHVKNHVQRKIISFWYIVCICLYNVLVTKDR